MNSGICGGKHEAFSVKGVFVTDFILCKNGRASIPAFAVALGAVWVGLVLDAPGHCSLRSKTFAKDHLQIAFMGMRSIFPAKPAVNAGVMAHYRGFSSSR